MALSSEDHGGGCCGINHLYGFYLPRTPKENSSTYYKRKIEFINKGIERCLDVYDDNFCDGGDNCGCGGCDCGSCPPPPDDEDGCGQPTREKWRSAIECVLAEPQIPEWRKPLEECGFKEVFTFLNSNSRNRCYVFYLETGGV
jgi:hypothetical protein